MRRLGRCYVCLGGRHIARNCRAQVTCENCGRRHFKVVCPQAAFSGDHETHKKADAPDTLVSISPVQSNHNHNTVFLQTAVAWIETPIQDQFVRCLLDGGSQRSFIQEDISRSLKLPVIGEETLNLHTFGSATPKRIKCRKVSVTLELLETPNVCASKLQIADAKVRRALETKGRQVADIPIRGMDMELGILIGGDYYWKIVTGQMERMSDTLVALESTFGWLLQGTATVLNTTVETLDIGMMHVSVAEDISLSDQLRTFWETESIGIYTDKEPLTMDDEAMKKFRQTVTLKEKRSVCHGKENLLNWHRI